MSSTERLIEIGELTTIADVCHDHASRCCQDVLDGAKHLRVVSKKEFEARKARLIESLDNLRVASELKAVAVADDVAIRKAEK